MKYGLLKEHSLLLEYSLRGLDIFCVIGGFLIGYYAVFDVFSMGRDYQVALIIAISCSAWVFSEGGLYRAWRGESRLVEVGYMVSCWVGLMAILVVLSAITKTTAEYSRVWLAVWFFSGIVLCGGVRAVVRQALRWMRQKGLNHRQVLVIGEKNMVDDVVHRLNSTAWVGLDVMEIIYVDKHCSSEGESRELAEALKRCDVDQVWIALPLSYENCIQTILHDLRFSPAEIRLVPDIFGFRLINHSLSEVAGLPVLNITSSPIQGVGRLMKFLFDFFFSLAVIVFLSPVFLLIAVGVKISSPGPVLYRQQRVSWNGKAFMMYKFRSMPVQVEESSGPVWARSGDDRATKFGAFIRKTSLDELPQFFNVLKGQMSVVGPRPERPVFVEKFKEEIPDYMKKHMVKAGITGWAQVSGWRGSTDLERRIQCDMYYIENWSLWFDIKIVLFTVFKGFVHDNAY